MKGPAPTAPIVIAGGAGLDRIWQLSGPLRPGGRIGLVARRCRMGGAGANAAAALAAMGCRPVLAARVADDAAGDALLARLDTAGVDLGAVERVAGRTRCGDILLGADGERTLISAGPRPQSLPARLTNGGFSVALVNLPGLADPAGLEHACTLGTVVAQAPLDLGVRRPAQVLIASRSDVAALPAGALWARRREVDGPVLQWLVVTDGPGGVEVVQETGVRHLAAASAVAGDSIGAGDFFAAGLIAALHHGEAVPAAVQAGQASAARFLARRPAPVDAWMPDAWMPDAWMPDAAQPP